ncbi:MAG TPA: class I SAM-dependent RNA methyltransferase [Azospirillaceae bacterium]|nr:class I SAM-dependent RNA methyltransferase [Azospirillaceae bacterium]
MRSGGMKSGGGGKRFGGKPQGRPQGKPQGRPQGRPQARPQHKAPPVPPPSLEPVEVTIEQIGGRGDGVAHWRGERLFVPQTLPGDRLMVRFGAQRGDGWMAEPVTLLESAAGRVEAPCAHIGSCGGCALQHLDDSFYDRWKLDLLRTAMARAGLPELPFEPLVKTPAGGRRRAVLAAARRGRRMWLGFNERASHRLVDVEGCPVMQPPLQALLDPLRRLLLSLVPDETKLDVALTLLDDGADVVLEGLPEPDLAALEALGTFAGEHDLARLSWRRKPGAAPEPIALRRDGVVRFGSVTVSPAPGAFLQASREGEAALVALALAGTAGAESVADLFAGSGTLTFPLAERSRVHAVESDAQGIRCLEGGARQLPTGRVTVERRDLFREPLSAAELGQFQAVVFDPPRAGAQGQAEALAASSVPSVVAISCNPQSFARDARILVDGGYNLERVVPVDQFLWSPHLEVAAVFRR